MVAIRVKSKRKMMSKTKVYLTDKVKTCGNFFLDSGAHSLYTVHVIEKGHAHGYSYYKSKEFYKYVDRYAEFVRKYKKGMDFYANVDVIFNPKLSWKIQKYLENEHGLKPIPVIHYGTPMEWVDKYLDAGYTFLGIGGLGQEATKQAYLLWADRLFEKLCPGPDHLPIVRTHGFAMTAHQLMLRYPWWSVDSASWAKLAGFGWIYVPYKRNGGFDFTKTPNVVAFSHRSRFLKNDGRHYYTMRPRERKTVLDWLDEIDMPLGTMEDDKSQSKDYGVASEYNARAVANLRFFEKLCDWMPKYPWPFLVKPRTGFLPWERIR